MRPCMTSRKALSWLLSGNGRDDRIRMDRQPFNLDAVAFDHAGRDFGQFNALVTPCSLKTRVSGFFACLHATKEGLKRAVEPR